MRQVMCFLDAEGCILASLRDKFKYHEVLKQYCKDLLEGRECVGSARFGGRAAAFEHVEDLFHCIVLTLLHLEEGGSAYQNARGSSS